ncbi:MAG TPA: dienelactone hydrolase family protein [Planctomycetota bacterium]|nr:dienelactone hydrolase family protein [Planctomycetota bacterium]
MRAAACCLASALAALVLAAEAPPALAPGKETRVNDPKVGGGYFVVYVPSDYSPRRRWPVIFCYHGQGGKPTAWPFKEVTGGKGFVVVGMGYCDDRGRRMTMPEFDRYLAREEASVANALVWVGARLKVDKEQLLVGGFSMGGWMASSMGEAASQLWAGVAILGAGRQKLDLPMRDRDAFRNKPVYIGAGDKDPNFPHAKKAADFYTKAGARVTFEEYPGLAHQMKTDTTVLRDWLLARVAAPQQLKARLAAARVAEQAGRLGKAHTLYAELAAVSDADESCAAAAESAKGLADAAEAKLSEIEKAIAEGRRAEAGKLLVALATRYEASPFADRADALLNKLQSAPAPAK